MEVGALRHAVSRGEFGQNFLQDARLAQNAEPAQRALFAARLPVGVQQQVQFGKDAFGRDVADERMVFLCSGKALCIGRKSRLGGLTCKADKAQAVLAEHLRGGGDGAQRFCADIRYAAQRIAECAAFDFVIDGVRAEVPAARVERDIVGKDDPGGRVQAAHVLIGTETGIFIAGAVGIAQFYRARIAVDGAHRKTAFPRGLFEELFGGRGAEIPVGLSGGKTCQKVADASAHQVQGGGQRCGKFFERTGDQTFHGLSPRNFSEKSITDLQKNCNHARNIV